MQAHALTVFTPTEMTVEIARLALSIRIAHGKAAIARNVHGCRFCRRTRRDCTASGKQYTQAADPTCNQAMKRSIMVDLENAALFHAIPRYPVRCAVHRAK